MSLPEQVLKQQSQKDTQVVYFGDFPTDSSSKEHLTIVFSSAGSNLQQRWKNNSLSADFLADYFSNFFPGELIEPSGTVNLSEVRNAISFIANELIENGLKFNYDPDLDVVIRLQMQANRLIFLLTNSVNPSNVAKFQAFLRELLDSDVSELYIRQLEKNAAGESNFSGMGFLTILQDYGAKMAWRFTTSLAPSPTVMVTTLVDIAL